MIKQILKNKKIRTILALLLIFALTIQTIAVEGLAVKAEETQSQSTSVKEDKLEILYEVESLRSEYSKSFLQSDGTYLQVTSLEPLHYKEGDSFEEIDNRLETVTEGNQITYQNKKSDYQVSFPDDLTHPVKIQKGKHTLSMQMISEESTSSAATSSAISEKPKSNRSHVFKKQRIQNQKNKSKANKEQKQSVSQKGMDYEEILPEYKTSEITYTDETGETDVIYETLPDRIKESIVLDSADAAKEHYTYQIEAKGLEAKKEKGGRILFYKKG